MIRQAGPSNRTTFAVTLLAIPLFLAAGCGGDSGAGPNTVDFQVTPGSTLLVGIGSFTTLQAVDSDDDPFGPSSVTWSSDDPTVATVSTGGTVTAQGEGTTSIVAEVGGTTRSATVEVWIPVEPDPTADGTSFLGRNEYVEYIPGTLPLVISAPHGGDLRPSEIPDRTFGTTVRDTNTRELTLRIRTAFLLATGHAPHVVVSHLHRIKLDPNREIVEAAQSDPFAENAWTEFQGWIELAGDQVVRDFGSGFYVDMHGHGHPVDRIELGYLLSSASLNATDEELDTREIFSQNASIRTLAQTTDVEFSDLLRGATSLGRYLADEGYASVPSPANPDPGGEPYFTGGHNTERHGSANGGPISGVQFEHHFPGLRDSPGNRQAYAAAFATALEAFMLRHYGFFVPEG